MSIEAYEQLMAGFELYDKLKVGIEDVKNGDTRPFKDALADIRSRRKG